MRTYCIAQGTHSMLCGDLNGKEIQKRGDICIRRVSLVAPVVKNPSANTGVRKGRFNTWVGKIPWRRKFSPLQHSRLENSLDSWQATVHSVAQSWTQPKRLSMHASHEQKIRHCKATIHQLKLKFF